MASRETQEALNRVKSICNSEYFYNMPSSSWQDYCICKNEIEAEFMLDKDIDTLQQTIDRLKIAEKALYKACSIINKQFNGCYHCENKRCTAEINKVDDCGIEKLEEYLLKESEEEDS